MMTIFAQHKLLALTALLALSLAAAGCDSDNSKLTGPKKDGDASSEQPDNGGSEDASEQPQKDAENGTEDAEDPFVPGFMFGPWQVTNAEDDAPIGSFTLIQAEGEPPVTGTFLAGEGLYDGMVNNASGDVGEGSSFDGNTLVLKWNPTTQDDELMTITATKVDENKFAGKMTAVQNVGLDMDVAITRVLDEP